MKKLASFLLVFFAAFLVVYMSVLFYVGKNVYSDNKTKSDAILVLGAKSYKGNVYNPCLEARVQHAVGLYKQGYAARMIMSGGNDNEDNSNEAATMSKIAREQNVPANKIILENKSSSTYENIRFTKRVMEENNLKSVIIVTEPFHSPRAALIARSAGLDFSMSPTLTSQCWSRWKYGSRYFLREPFAIMLYFLQGKI